MCKNPCCMARGSASKTLLIHQYERQVRKQLTIVCTVLEVLISSKL